MINYANASYQELARLLKSYITVKRQTCEKGHQDCGCTTEANPPCVLAVIGEIEGRRSNEGAATLNRARLA